MYDMSWYRLEHTMICPPSYVATVLLIDVADARNDSELASETRASVLTANAVASANALRVLLW